MHKKNLLSFSIGNNNRPENKKNRRHESRNGVSAQLKAWGGLISASKGAVSPNDSFATANEYLNIFRRSENSSSECQLSQSAYSVRNIFKIADRMTWLI